MRWENGEERVYSFVSLSSLCFFALFRGARQKPIASKVFWRLRSSFYGLAIVDIGGLWLTRFPRPDPHQLLAEIGALQKPHERSRSAV